MRALDDVILDPALKKRALAKRQPREGNKVLMRAAGYDFEFGAHVDEVGVGGREVGKQAGGKVD